MCKWQGLSSVLKFFLSSVVVRKNGSSVLSVLKFFLKLCVTVIIKTILMESNVLLLGIRISSEHRSDLGIAGAPCYKIYRTLCKWNLELCAQE